MVNNLIEFTEQIRREDWNTWETRCKKQLLNCMPRTATCDKWWRHQMKTFSALLPFAQGIHRSPVNSTYKGQWRRALMFSLICAWINGWVNNREAGDLRRYRAHYDVIVMSIVMSTFWFLSFLVRLLVLTYRLPDQILVDFRHDLDLEFSMSNMELAISQPKMVRLPRNEKQAHRLNSRPQMWPSGLTLAMTLTLNFQGQVWNWLNICQKCSHCHETKSKHIDWTLGLKCDHQAWPWPWPWPWIFKVKYEICYISI